MFIINRFLGCTLWTVRDSQEDIDPENSTLRKIAACIPGVGLIINEINSRSLHEKLRELPLPRNLKHPRMGKILDENASPEEIETVCKRAIQLKSINRDYIKAALVNSILTIALAVYALSINVIPFVVGAISIVGFSLAAAAFTFGLYTDDSTKRYEKILEKEV